MKFFEHISMYDDTRKNYPAFGFRNAIDYYKEQLKHRNEMDEQTAVQLTLELDWYELCRPYYKVWPSIVKSLRRIKLAVTVPELKLPDFNCCLRMADGHAISCGEESIETMLVMSISRGFVVSVNWHNRFGELTYLVFNIKEDGKTIEESINERAPTELNNLVSTATQIAITVLLISKDPSIITPEVLNADAVKFAETGDPKYIEKAKRRGVVGWNIGKEYESCPHYRRPHYGLRYTGKDGSIPRIVPIKGTMVQPHKVTQVPTGYILPSGQEVE